MTSICEGQDTGGGPGHGEGLDTVRDQAWTRGGPGHGGRAWTREGLRNKAKISSYSIYLLCRSQCLSTKYWTSHV